jgi:uncharacterized RDD family membrane protein YckC
MDMEGQQFSATVPADKASRVVGYLIDVAPLLVFSLISLIPIIGVIVYGIFLVFYWLLRDITGASLGKLIVGLRVVSKDGSPAGLGARVIRNLTIATPGVMLAIPFAGYVAGPSCGVLVTLAEAIMLLGTGERIGDRIAGTMVVKKAQQ